MAQETDAPEVARVPRTPGMKKWRCLTCQYLLESELLPFRCPRCGASRVKMLDVTAKGTAPAEAE